MTRIRLPNSDTSFGAASGQPASAIATSFGARRATLLLAVLFLVFHLPYLPASLEDLDSINFALGVRHFDVAHHQPHPPGYPMFIAVAKAVHAVIPVEATALGFVSAVSGALGVVALGALFRRLDGPSPPTWWTFAGAVIAMTTPLYWFTAVRPLSDSAGLAAALGVQAMTLAASTRQSFAAAAFCAGLAAGIRSQVAWLTVPLVALRAFQGLGAGDWGLGTRHWGLGDGSAVAGSEPEAPSPKLPATSAQLPAAGRQLPAPGRQLPAPSPQSPVPAIVAFCAGLLLWFIPLVLISGGPAAYWHALFDQGAEDFGNIQMLWTRHGVRDVVDALYYAFIAPWAIWPVGAIVVACMLVGVVHLLMRHRRGLLVLAVAFGPYLIFDLLFQETFTSRYALPLVPPMAYLAVYGLRAMPWGTGTALAAALAMFCAHLGGTSIAAFSRASAPAFQLLDAMRSAASSAVATPVLAADRRQSLDLRRPIAWLGSAMPPMERTLPAPPQHEWLEAVRYWNEGGRAPVWFVVDPLRTSIDLVQHGEPQRFRWPVAYPSLLSGTRPNEMDWYRVDRPDWYVGEGWALTPEAAGVAAADHRGPSIAPIDGWVARGAGGGTLMIGGRNLASSPARLTLQLEGQTIADENLGPGFFVHFVPLPDAARDARRYDKVTVAATAGSRVAIEQFDASAERPLAGYATGWHEPEFDPQTGLRWRWLSERAELTYAPNVRVPADVNRGTAPLILHLEGESSLRYFSRPSLLTISANGQSLVSMRVTANFSIDVPVTGAGPLVFETDQVFSPADGRWRRSGDRRHLGLRIFKAEVRRAKRPAS